MRISAQARGRLRHAHHGQQVHDTRPGSAPADRLVRADHLDDLIADADDGIQRRHRLLEHHCDVAARHRATFARGQRQQVGAAELDTAARDRHRRLRQQAHDRERGQALAAPRLPDQCHRLVLVHVERQAFDDRPARPIDLRCQHQVADGKERLHQRDRVENASLRRGSSRSRTASPTRFNENALSAIISPGNNSSHGARVM